MERDRQKSPNRRPAAGFFYGPDGKSGRGRRSISLAIRKTDKGRKGANPMSVKHLRESLRKQEGSTILLAMFVVLIGSSLIFMGLTLLLTSRDAIVHELHLKGQATGAAEAGISDALSWFRRQQTQPVEDFSPILDPENNIFDTEDPEIGIVREFRISPQSELYGRYEVMKIDPYTSEPVVQDISPQRFISPDQSVAGRVWYVESKGIVYEQNDPQKPFNEWPNHVVRRVTLASEIQRIAISLPADAALITCGNDATIGNGGLIRGMDFTGIAFDRDGHLSKSQGDVSGNPAVNKTELIDLDSTPIPDLIRSVFSATGKPPGPCAWPSPPWDFGLSRKRIFLPTPSPSCCIHRESATGRSGRPWPTRV